MITTFFGPQSFGGDATHVDRLTRALARRGHEVHVVHDSDAFETVRAGAPARRWAPLPPGVTVHTLASRAGRLAPLWTHQTGGPGPKSRPLERILRERSFDVIHFHNISLLGGPRLLGVDAGRPRPVKLMTLHDYWLVCPMHLLWKLGRTICDRPQCLRCVVHGRRPPQLWRRSGLLERELDELDALLAPSSYAAELHRERGVRTPIHELPYHLPRDWGGDGTAPATGNGHRVSGRPYFAAAGRLVDEKGFEGLVELMRDLPGVDLKLAGAGPREPALRELADGMANVELLGLLDYPELAALFAGARALVAPSLFPETFGYAVAEALSVGTPALVRRNGALPELVGPTGGGIAYESTEELKAAMRRLAVDDEFRRELGDRGRAGVETMLDEDAHIDRYLTLIQELRSRGGRRARASGPPSARG